MNTILISAEAPPELKPLGFPVVCLYLYPRQPDTTADEKFVIWQKVRDLVNTRCGGEAAFVGRDDGLLFYPNHHTPMLAALLTEPAFFDVLEEHELDGRAMRLFFQYFYRLNEQPGWPDAFALQAEEKILPTFNAALRKMHRYSEALQPIAPDAPKARVLCGPMPPLTWFLKPLPGTPAHHTAVSAFQKTGTDL